ncbi:SOS response-associated peptidase [Maribacter sp. ACAM166]|uniref:SOS response-associated peptidase n=1 Tax=Maribacter sp. ACAM166 TaxID=2508996 RepID=UPI0010FE9A8E|nr:SOS response-associated peptidase family protein [Maribacter sp. ACAM166]TLP70618.1 SOS response-associated peptidase [Maribacter sp. ACAM166]
MYFKISNTAEMKEIERETKALFKYPNLYEPQIVISGLTEVSIPIITMEDSDIVSLAIWGLLPTDYKDDWELFQKLTNTLNIHTDTLESDLWYSDSFYKRRCIIPVTGFYASILRNGEIYPYFVSAKNGGLVYLAGIYTVLDDGFITCSVLTGPVNEYLKGYQNLVNFMPLIIHHDDKEEWLSEYTKITRAKEILNSSQPTSLRTSPIAKGLFNQDISYDSMLMPFEHPENY